MEIFFTSDTHAWHGNIIKYCNRPFSSSEEMTGVLADRINERVMSGDILYHIGDFAFGTPAMIEHFRQMINCRTVYLICGNHDKRIRRDKNLQRLFTKVHMPNDDSSNSYVAISVNVGGQRITLCHTAARIWPGSHHGAWHLYGHSHGSLSDDPNAFSFDCGVDTHNFYPYNIDEVAHIMSTKTFKPIDHHIEDM